MPRLVSLLIIISMFSVTVSPPARAVVRSDCPMCGHVCCCGKKCADKPNSDPSPTNQGHKKSTLCQLSSSSLPPGIHGMKDLINQKPLNETLLINRRPALRLESAGIAEDAIHFKRNSFDEILVPPPRHLPIVS